MGRGTLLGGFAVALGLLAAGATRRLSAPEAPEPSRVEPGATWVELGGSVARPGLRRFSRPTSIGDALASAGGSCRPANGFPTLLEGGERVSLERGPPCLARVSRLPAEVRTALGLPLDPNLDDADGLALLPLLGPKRARAIVQGRPYRRLDDLLRVRGIGPKTVGKLRGYLRISEESLEGSGSKPGRRAEGWRPLQVPQ